MWRLLRDVEYRNEKLRQARAAFGGRAFSESDLWRAVGVGDTTKWIKRWIREGHAMRLTGGQRKLYRFVERGF